MDLQKNLFSMGTGGAFERKKRKNIARALSNHNPNKPTDSPDEPKAQKVAERAHRQPKQAKGTQKGLKIMKKWEKEKQTKTFLHFHKLQKTKMIEFSRIEFPCK